VRGASEETGHASGQAVDAAGELVENFLADIKGA
jgi:hypothetical protein|tara:strand:- start:114 stop:215 length:102 start_codon:yes stop_codon:yes gene_type:complete